MASIVQRLRDGKYGGDKKPESEGLYSYYSCVRYIERKDQPWTCMKGQLVSEKGRVNSVIDGVDTLSLKTCRFMTESWKEARVSKKGYDVIIVDHKRSSDPPPSAAGDLGGLVVKNFFDKKISLL